MTRFTTKTPQQQVLDRMKPVSKLIIVALNKSLVETKRQFHALGTPLIVGKPYDKSYFSHTMRYVARHCLDESGLQARIEEETESPYQLGQAANTGILLEAEDIVARLLKSPLDEDLPRAGSESRADFYEQRQYKIIFPPFGEEVQEQAPQVQSGNENAFHLVYAWDANADLSRVFLKLVCPNDRSGKHEWQHIFPEDEMGFGSVEASGPSSPQSPAPLSLSAAAANTDLDLSPREDDQKEQVKPGAAKRA